MLYFHSCLRYKRIMACTRTEEQQWKDLIKNVQSVVRNHHNITFDVLLADTLNVSYDYKVFFKHLTLFAMESI